MKAKKVAKRLFITLFILLTLLIGALIAIPYFFEDEVAATVKEAVNNNLNAKFDFEDLNLSLLRNFPNLSLDLEKYSVEGIGDFEGVPLIKGDALRFVVDILSVVKGDGPVEIKAIRLDKPVLNVLVLRDGKANYDIAKESDEPQAGEEPAAMQIKLQQYSIKDGKLVYEDRLSDVSVEANKLNHSGSGDFTLDVYDLQTKTTIGELTSISGGVAYLKKAKVELLAGINVDLPKMKFSLRENDLRINDLQLKADGFVALPNENDVEMDLKFSAPKNDFKNLLSLVPNAYIEGYKDVKASGKFKLDGFVKGVYSSASPERYPAFKINLDVENGKVKYPDLPLGISGIASKMTLNSPSSNLGKMKVDISTFKLKIGSNPVAGYFKIKTPISDPDIDTKIEGKLNLEELSKAFPMEGVESLSGLITANIVAKVKQSVLDKGDYEKANMSGNLRLKNMNYTTADMPPVKIKNLQLDFSPRQVKVSDFDARLGKSDLNAKGTIDNILAWFSPKKTMRGNFTLRSHYFNADEWMPEEESSPVAAGSPSEEADVFDRFDFSFDAKVNKIDYDVYEIKKAGAKGDFTPNKLTINQLNAQIGKSDFETSGYLTNVFNYLFKNETLGGRLTLKSKMLDLNEFMVEEDAATAAANAEDLEPILVPEKVRLQMKAEMDKVRYANIELEDVKGDLLVEKEAVQIQNVKGKTFGGTMTVNGSYNTQNHDQPNFDLNYDMERMDFQKAFNAVNTFQLLAPIGKFVEGKFNSRLSMNSDLKKDLMPNLKTLIADGFLQTFDGKISGFQPLDAIGNKLNVDAFKTISIKNSKNWFEVKNGAVELKPFDYTTDSIAMKISGMNYLEGGMDYKIIAKIPRSKIGKNAVGQAANTGLDFLGKEAGKLGLNEDAGEFVNVQINLRGSATQPKLGFKLLGTDGKTSLGKAVTGTLEKEAGQEVSKAKKSFGTILNNAKKDLLTGGQKGEPKDSITQDTVAAAREKPTKKLEKEADKLKDAFKKLNPFKKKKGGG